MLKFLSISKIKIGNIFKMYEISPSWKVGNTINLLVLFY